MSLMPASSSSLSFHCWRYHVFPSFCGSDVRKKFLSHLQKELQLRAINAFKDHRIRRSRSIWPELKHAICASRISIVILSKEYGGSSWCLDELVEIMECRKAAGQTLLTVFYEVDPSDVRKQTGAFGKAFGKTCLGRTVEERRRWKQALIDVASVSGYCSEKWHDEASMVEKIVADVLEELNFCTPLKEFENFVGLEAHVAKLNTMLCLHSNDVRMIGIWGPIGIGKTTIARALYNQLSSDDDGFQMKLFMENVKGSNKRNKLDGYMLKSHSKERFLLQIFSQMNIEISNLGVAQEMLKNQKALSILDDGDELEQLHALADQTPWFGNGTRIIVITEDEQLLRAHGIDHVYEVSYPSKGEAFQIFCRFAFGKNSAPEGYYDLAAEVAKLSGDLPLGLRILGASLRGMSKEEWITALPRLRTSLNGKIDKLVRACYDGLDEKDKSLFLHIACLFIGKKVDRVMQLLAKSALDAEFGLRVLVDRTLIHISANGYIVMHCLLQQMGKEIIRGQCLHEPGKRKFLVDALEISDLLADETGTESVIGMSLNMSEIDGQVYISKKAF